MTETLEQYAHRLALRDGPISDECAEQAARILVAAMRESGVAA